MIHFTRLNEYYFPFLLKWLQAPHVKLWWDHDINWTIELIEKKYSNYVKGYKIENKVMKPIEAYIINKNHVPIGYIQIYNAYDFPRAYSLHGLPKNLGALDMFIGEKEYLNNNIGSQSIKQFFKDYSVPYSHIFVDPENTNISAIRAYEKAGFKKINQQAETREVWMLLDISQYHLKPLPSVIDKDILNYPL